MLRVSRKRPEVLMPTQLAVQKRVPGSRIQFPPVPTLQD